VHRVFIELFQNRTLQPLLENEITNAVTERLSRGRALTLVRGADQGDAVLSGMVTFYETVPISYDTQDDIVEYRSTMSIAAVLRRTGNGPVVWSGSVTWNEEYPANRDKALQEDNEAAAIAEISDRLADELYSRVVSNF
jgi:outer membrane lipopolysaccharide assembly protein LptE/RlpB